MSGMFMAAGEIIWTEYRPNRPWSLKASLLDTEAEADSLEEAIDNLIVETQKAFEAIMSEKAPPGRGVKFIREFIAKNGGTEWMNRFKSDLKGLKD